VGASERQSSFANTRGKRYSELSVAGLLRFLGNVTNMTQKALKDPVIYPAQWIVV
jgi:hypothetical protein